MTPQQIFLLYLAAVNLFTICNLALDKKPSRPWTLAHPGTYSAAGRLPGRQSGRPRRHVPSAPQDTQTQILYQSASLSAFPPVAGLAAYDPLTAPPGISLLRSPGRQIAVSQQQKGYAAKPDSDPHSLKAPPQLHRHQYKQHKQRQKQPAAQRPFQRKASID